MECTEEGRSVGLEVSLMEDGLLGVPSDDGFEAFNEVERLDIEAGFLVPSWLCREAIEDVRSVL